ncbi:MAG: Serine phosphatase RsbU, regulator of sigma subunit [Candidatus Ozemobacter sibiricus]|uniref:Serine phosphatase RsbU, regulator of sigma subunit n=1 Tax=Candidatus Ozemobacter sibiricus TaxID=2268124 RepID=A0A367ZJI6_9BACT|nr:MAG: Serine phosphatase RsbU, regulator of sigma subunit [Candidatus Ozemobacter sibiricus]
MAREADGSWRIIAGLWAVLVFIPLLLGGWILHGVLGQVAAATCQAIARDLERAARRLLHRSHPSHAAVRELQTAMAEAGATGSGPVRLPPPADPRASQAVIHRLQEFFATGRPLDTTALLRVRHRLGWAFNPMVTREHPWIPEEIRWNGRPAWLVWAPGPGRTTASLVIAQPPPVADLLRAACQTSFEQGRWEWLVIDRASRRWWGSRALAADLRPLLAGSRQRPRGWLPTPHALTLLESVDRTTRLALRAALPWPVRAETHAWLWFGLAMAGVAATLVFPRLCRRYLTWSLRWKLLGLLAYLILVPLAGGLLLGCSFLDARRLSLEQQGLDDALAELERYDASFLQYLRTLEIRLDRFHAAVATGRAGPATLTAPLAALIRAVGPDRLVLLDRGARLLFDHCSTFRYEALMNEVGTAILQQHLEPYPPDQDRPAIAPRFKLIHDTLMNSAWGSHYQVEGALQRFTHGGQTFYTYWRRFPRRHPSLGLLAADFFHDPTVRAFFARHRPGGTAGRLLVWHRRSRTWYPARPAGLDDLEALVEAADRRGEAVRGEVDQPDGPTLAIALPGHRLRGCVLVSLLAPERQPRPLAGRRQLLGVGAGLALAVALACWLLLAQGILDPIREILAGIARLRRLDTAHPIPVMGDDELATLARGINRMMTISDELDLARVVQRAFVPAHLPPLSRVRAAFWESSRLGVGGCFFDWYPGPDGTWVFLLGTAPGQGIRAALLLAMVKALAFLHFREGRPPGEFLRRAREALPALGLTQACCSLALVHLDERGPSVTVMAAGAPFALWRRGAQDEACFVGQPTSPLGAATAVDPEPIRLELAAGGGLLLFTHGLVNAPDPEGKPWGHDALRALFSRPIVPQTGELAGSGTTDDPLRPLREAFQRHVRGGEQGKEGMFLLERVEGPPA